MNFLNTLKTGEVPVELKYCERCGGLWLRPQGEDVVYCRGCQEHMAAWPRAGERPAPHPRGPQERELQEQDLQSHDPIECLAGVAGIEVRP
jgi:Zn-finger nucleic acid-binding protein